MRRDIANSDDYLCVKAPAAKSDEDILKVLCLGPELQVFYLIDICLSLFHTFQPIRSEKALFSRF